MDQNLGPYVKSNKKLDIQKNPLKKRRFFWAPKTFSKNMGKKIFTILRWKFLFI